MKFTYVMGTNFTKLKWFFHNVSFIINTVFPPLLGTPTPVALNSLLKRCGPVTDALSIALKPTDPPSNWANVLGILTIHDSRTSVNLCRTGAFCSKKFNHHALLSTCYCVERTWLIGAPVIVVEMNSVAVRWVGQGTLPGAKFKGKIKRHFFLNGLRLS